MRAMGKIGIKGCPHCGKTVSKGSNANWPFCSDRCRTIDLGNWSLERYRIAGKKVEGEEGNCPSIHVRKNLRGDA